MYIGILNAENTAALRKINGIEKEDKENAKWLQRLKYYGFLLEPGDGLLERAKEELKEVVETAFPNRLVELAENKLESSDEYDENIPSVISEDDLQNIKNAIWASLCVILTDPSFATLRFLDTKFKGVTKAEKAKNEKAGHIQVD